MGGIVLAKRPDGRAQERRQVVASFRIDEDAVDAKLVGADGGVDPAERLQQRRGALRPAHLGIWREGLLRLGRADNQPAAQLALQALAGESGQLFRIGSR